MPFSSSPAFTWASAAFGTIFVGFGINAIVNPTSALSFYELAYTSSKAVDATIDKIIQSLLVVYGIRDIFMGTAIYAAAYFGPRTDKRILGCIVGIAGLTAGVDGAVCKFIVGKGAANHWSYAPILILMGAAMATGL